MSSLRCASFPCLCRAGAPFAYADHAARPSTVILRLLFPSFLNALLSTKFLLYVPESKMQTQMFRVAAKRELIQRDSTFGIECMPQRVVQPYLPTLLVLAIV